MQELIICLYIFNKRAAEIHSLPPFFVTGNYTLAAG
jgi:hypothetical protein